MSETLKFSVEVYGQDPELQAGGMIVQILEGLSYWQQPQGGLRHLSAEEKSRVARYIAERYAL